MSAATHPKADITTVYQLLRFDPAVVALCHTGTELVPRVAELRDALDARKQQKRARWTKLISKMNLLSTPCMREAIIHFSIR
jgi:hypothetical protein